MTTALAVRALLGNASSGHGQCIDRGVAYLARNQREDGSWSREQCDAPALGTACVLMQLGDRAAFRQAVRFVEAVEWFNGHATTMASDGPSKRLWAHASVRCRMTPADRDGFATLWTPARRPAA
jgi:hypothetical protein